MESQFSSNPDQYQGVCKHLWGIKVPNKVRSLLWRACKNALPVKTNLVRRNVLAEDICDHCKQMPEDMIHAIWLCYGDLGVWESDLAWDFRHTKNFPKFLDLVQFIIDEGKDLAQFAMFIQTLWFRRNRLRVEDKPFPLSDVLPMAKES